MMQNKQGLRYQGASNRKTYRIWVPLIVGSYLLPHAVVFQFPIRSRYHLRMSDKTKFYADQSLIAQRMRGQFARDKAKGDTRPRCQCGLTWNDVPLMWAMPVGRHEKAKFCCPACLPVEMLGLVAGDVGRLKDGE